VREMRNEQKNLVREPKEKRPLEDLGVDWRIELIWLGIETSVRLL
jgi:hypothetical protein